MGLREPPLDDVQRRFFAAAGPRLTAFALAHRLEPEAWFKDAPVWALRFRHPLGGEGRLDAGPAPDGSARLTPSWTRDDYDTESRRVATGEPVTCPVEGAMLEVRLLTGLRRTLGWKEADLGTPRFLPPGTWKLVWTKAQFEALNERLPEPRL